MAACWEIRLTVPDRAEVFAEMLAAAFDADAFSFHRDGDGGDWQVSVIAEAEPLEARVASALKEAKGITGVEASCSGVRPLADRDWLEENRKSFPPVDVACFHIRGSHVETPPPGGKLVLRLDAGQAFGSGTHATTQGCLAAMEGHMGDLPGPEGPPPRIADIGTGSGILAVAAAKLRSDAEIVAVDSDPVAVRVAGENAEANGVGANIAFGVSDGYGSALVRGGAPFDVILANILPSPLSEMAPEAASCLADRGVLVVSGLNEAHEDGVAAAHGAAGLALDGRFSLDGWLTLVFKHAGEGG